MESTLHIYTSTARWHGDRWIVVCDEHPRTRLDTRTLAEAQSALQAAIAGVLDVADDHVMVHVRPVLSDAVRTHLARARELRRQATRANHAAAGERRAAARALYAEGLSLRDVGIILGVSHQRAHQLVTVPARSDMQPSMGDAPHDHGGGERP